MAKSGKIGRPRKYTAKQVQSIKKKFENYIKDTAIPIIAEFAYQNNILRETLYDYAEFATLLKKAIEKKEANLEKFAIANKINVTMAIFSLKQLGWSDKVDMNTTTNEITSMTKEEIEGELETLLKKYANKRTNKKNTRT